MKHAPIRYGSLHTPPAPMPEARRLHVFGKLIPMDDLHQLSADAHRLGEPGLKAGTLIVASGLCAVFTAALLMTAFLCERNTMNTDPTAASARVRLADGGKN